MTEHTEKDVLMKCTKCGYEEEVPRWLIDELFPNEPEENYMMHCPECDHKMIVKKIIQIFHKKRGAHFLCSSQRCHFLT